jgi:hypothetical protein
MANSGKSFEEILNHYYRKAELIKVYWDLRGCCITAFIEAVSKVIFTVTLSLSKFDFC